MWGSNERGQLGLKLTTESAFSPMPVEKLQNAGTFSVAAAFEHSVVITDMGTVYAWGSNSHGQCGMGEVDVM